MRTAVEGFAVQSYIYGVQGQGVAAILGGADAPAVAAQREQYTELVLGSSVSKIDELETVSQDATQEIAEEFCARHSSFKTLQEATRGKGWAVRRGMLDASGEFRFMCDADLSMPINEISRFLPPTLDAFDIAIASREAPGAVRYNEPAYRHWGGRAVNLMIRLLALPGLHDTQCGFKCFRAEAAQRLFNCQTLYGWSFDVEILYLARLVGYRILEIPVPWYFDPESKVRAVPDALRMGRDLLSVRRNHRHGVYSECLG